MPPFLKDGGLEKISYIVAFIPLPFREMGVRSRSRET